MEHRPVRKRVGKRERAEERGLGRARVEEDEKEGGSGKTVKCVLRKLAPFLLDNAIQIYDLYFKKLDYLYALCNRT